MKIKIIDILIDFFYPPKCYYCKKLFKSSNSKYICDSCYSVLKESNYNVNRCPWCSKVLNEENVCTFCKNITVYKNHSIYSFSGFLREIVYDIKYSNNKYLCYDLAHLYETFLKENLDYFKSFDYIISVPLYTKKLHTRGFNQSDILAKEISKIIDVPYINILKRTKNTKALSKYNQDQRINILKGVFDLNPFYKDFDFTNKNILIIDDIFTTGSTINECGKVLIGKNIAKLESLCILIT